jgi:CMP-N,N'-diacetyllegionaminic acid synthase
MKILITLCGRAGSKGLPGKNIRQLGNLPLFAHSLKHAERFAKLHNADIAISTDDDRLLALAKDFGYDESYKRPASLATDDAGKVAVIRDLWRRKEEERKVQYDAVLDLDITSPIRSDMDLEEGYKLFKINPEALILLSVSRAKKNPYFNMVEFHDEKYVSLSKQSTVLARQEAPKVFEINGSFYFYSRAFLASDRPSVITSSTMAYEMKHICFDIDYPEDFEYMEFLYNRGLLKAYLD